MAPTFHARTNRVGQRSEKSRRKLKGDSAIPLSALTVFGEDGHCREEKEPGRRGGERSIKPIKICKFWREIRQTKSRAELQRKPHKQPSSLPIIPFGP